MGIAFIKNLDENTTIGCWDITDTLEELSQNIDSDDLIKISNNIKWSIKRKSQWLAVRQLLLHLTNNTEKIAYRRDGSPYLKSNNYFISIAHSQQYAVIYLSKNNKLGIDIQSIKNNISKGIHYFLNDAELASISSYDALQLNLIWSAKETLFKFHGNHDLNFKNNITIKPFTTEQFGNLEAYILESDKKIPMQVAYEVFDGYVMTWTIS